MQSHKTITLHICSKEDIDELVDFSQELHSITPHSCLTFAPEKLKQVLLLLVDRREENLLLIARHNDAIVGALGSTVRQPLYSYDKIATELLLWLKPGYSHIIKRFLSAYEYWSFNIAKVKIIHLSHHSENERINKLFKKFNYKVLETSYIKELGV